MAKNFGARKNAQYKVVSTSPSVNKTPRGPSIVDVPYDVQQDLGGAEGVSPNVNFNGDPVYVKTSHSSKVTGDKEGSKGGVKSGTVGAQSDPIETSPSVFVNGKAVVRVGDVQHMQNKNTVGKVVSSESGSAAHITDEGKIEGNTRPEPIAMPYSKNKPTNNTGSGSLGSRTGSPVLLASGKLFYTLSDADFIAPIDFGIRRTYLSDRHVGIFGNGWQLGYETRLKQNGSDTVTIFMTDDRAFRFREIENGFIDSDDLGASLTRLDSKTFVLEYFNDMHTERYENGYLSEIKEHNGNTLAFIRNSNGRIAKLFSANASLDFEYNPQGFVSRITDHTQRTWNYAYDRHGNLLRVTDPMGGVAQYHYQQNAPYYLERSIDASSVCTLEVSYDASERVEGYREKGESFSYRYEPNRVIKTNSTGDKTFYGIDTFGAIRAITYPDGSTTKEIYENNVSTVIDAGENCFIREFDERGRIIREARLGNVEILYSYEGDNPYESVKNDNGKITVHTYDARYNLLSTTYPDGKTESWNYDGRGNKVSYTDFTGITSEYAYNGVGQCIRSTDALGGITQYVYDDLGNMTAVVDPEERITAYEYDKLSRQIAITDTDNKTTRLYYDNAGRISAIRDPQGNMTRYLYDSKGLLVRTINPADQVRTFGYERGLLVSIACDNGETYRFTYDQRGRMTSQNVGNKTTKYTYDSLGNLLSAEDGENRVEYVYDAHANVILERQGNESVVYAYNAEGSRRFIGYEGEHYTLGRNESSHLTDIRKGINTYTMGYGMNGKQTSITYPNAHVTKNAFDPLGRLTERTIGNDSKMTYLYDKSSRIVMKNNTPIAYDAGCRVMRAGNESYTYDESGNLLKEESVIDPVTGRLMRQGDTAFTYDSLGRLSEKRSPVSRTTYRYDSQSYLIEYLKTEADYEIRFYFTYDPLGRRLTKHYIGKNGEYHHRYLYAGDNIVAIYDHDTEELLATLLHDETIDTPLSISVHPKSPLNPEELERYESLDETEQYLFNQSRIQTYYYHRDHQNSILSLSDQEEKIIESYSYDTFGNITHHSKILETYNPYGYTGRETDTDDLYYYRARYYDPTMGRFITPDPIGFLSGDTNFYRYVGNDPVNYTDPSGLSGLTALLDQHNPLKDLVEWWNATPDTSIPTTSIPNSTILQGKINTQTNKTQTATSKNATVGGASNSTGAKVKGNVEQKVDEKCKDQKWHDPIDNPQLAMYMQSGGIAPYWNVFGKVRNGGKHQGVDLLALPGTPVYACVDGTIKIGDMQPRPPKKVNYGKYVLIKAQCPSFVQTLKKAYSLPYKDKGEMEKEMSFKDDGDFYFFYAHLLEVDEKLKKAFEQGDVVRVKAGQIIGKTGTSGYTTSADPHLHFEITSKPFLNRVNPGFYLNYKLPRDLTQEESNRQKTIAKKRHGDPSTQK